MLSRLADHRFVQGLQDGTLMRSALELTDAIIQAGCVPPACEPVLDELRCCLHTVKAELARRGLSLRTLSYGELGTYSDGGWEAPLSLSLAGV